MDGGILFGLGVMFLWGCSKLFSKRAVDWLGALPALFWNYVAVLVVVLLGILPFARLRVLSLPVLPLYLGAVFIGAFGITFLFKAMRSGASSLVFPVAHSSVVVTVFLSLVFLGERLGALQGLGVFLLVVGVVLISFRTSDIAVLGRLSVFRGFGWAFLTLIYWGVYYTLIKLVVVDVGPLLATLYLEGGISIVVLVMVARSVNPLVAHRRGWGLALAGGALTVGGSLMYNLGLLYLPNSIMTTFGQASLLVALVGSFILFKEKITWNQVVAILLIVAGVLCVSF